MPEVNTHLRNHTCRWQHFVDWLLPTPCVVCGALSQQALCPDCAATILSPEPACLGCALPLPSPLPAVHRCGQCHHSPLPLDRVMAALIYQWPVDDLICRFKFQHAFACGRLLAKLMALQAIHWPRPEVIVPIPAHRARLRQRGFDQTLLLGRMIARHCHIPCHCLLVRTDFAAPQSRLGARARQKNVRQVFQYRPLKKMTFRHVAVIDDVMTTGATLSAAAHCLRRSGIDCVHGWVCARVL